jgi:DNA replication protein DnaC
LDASKCPGAGKSLWAALVVRRLIEQALIPLEPTRLSDDEIRKLWPRADIQAVRAAHRDLVYRAAKRWPVHWVQLSDLCQRIRDRWNSPDKTLADPMRRAETAPLLVLDDVGASVDVSYDDRGASLHGRPGDHERKVLWQLVESRTRAQLPTIITTNLPPEHLLQEHGCVYGPRTGSRLAAMVGDNVVELGRVSWREPPPPTVPARRRRAGGAP